MSEYEKKQEKQQTVIQRAKRVKTQSQKPNTTSGIKEEDQNNKALMEQYLRIIERERNLDLEVKKEGDHKEQLAYSEKFDPNAFANALIHLPAGERVAVVKEKVNQLAPKLGLVKSNKLTKLNRREVYVGRDGWLYALDTQHGAFEKANPRTGEHIDEVNLNLTEKNHSKYDKSGKHDLKVG